MAINIEELELANNIIKKGFEKSTESLSFFIKEKLTIDDFSIEMIQKADVINAISGDLDELFVLVTEIVGNIRGICYLILNKNEADKILNMSLPENVRSNPKLLEQMEEAVLLEVDNIITASVVTEFANTLKVKLYGDVPRLHKISHEKIKSLINGNIEKKDYAINLKVRFNSTDKSFTPQFIWFLGYDFIDLIRKIKDKE